TENTKKYIDFAAENGFDGVLVEGWNIGWDGDWIANGNVFSFTKAYPDFDIEALAKYAADKGVRLIGHHETSGGIANYENQMEDAFKLYQRLGYRAVKTGYVRQERELIRLDDQGKEHLEWHHGQYMVEHYRRVVELAAKYKIAINAHEPIKDTGIRRTYPNMMSREGARGQEFNAWSNDGGNPPEHTTILPFTRFLAGPMDFTPGIFDLLFEEAKPNNRVNTTLTKQLALYVVLYGPLQMAADLPENYRKHMDAFQFIKDVAVDWETTLVPHAQIGDYVTVVRKDRHSDDWFLGSLTDEEGRLLEVKLDFLDQDKNYVAEIYRDGENGHWKTNPYDYVIERKVVNFKTTLPLRLAAGGGTAIRFRPATASDM
ncbi:MAG TPA: glycoside hydrolase family 97 catalytic domain-containing protein, partial [Calditrichia bacterium]|nr:glycoside hydrolase family 97 catalytic domain-containing protein [Calditrichia bacterium]